MASIFSAKVRQSPKDLYNSMPVFVTMTNESSMMEQANPWIGASTPLPIGS
jgi:hypothetical protein